MSLPETERRHAGAGQQLILRRGFGVARWFLRRLLSHIEIGRLIVVTPEGVRRLLLHGDIGLAEAYRDGELDTPDLTALIELGARNDASLRNMLSGTVLARLLNRLRHGFNANTRAGSRRNIMAHYDLGNTFYGRWLDAGMSYSSALYDNPDETLEAAQDRKLDRIVAMLGLEGGEEVLEIGCGWGGLAERLARAGCRVTAVTLSPAQLAFAQERIDAAGLSDRVTVQLKDYRDIDGQFDRIVSVEMIEAVGQTYWPSYFRTLQRALKPGGSIVLQAITIDERVFESYVDGTDFIQRYIFPGGCLPSSTALEAEASRADLAISDELQFGASYALTLKEWRRRFAASWQGIAPLGFDESFRRLWEFYLCYCEAGFRAGTTDVRLLKVQRLNGYQ
jgi:cyclopropane-fatty-acyl-phospholipid synthase